MATVASQDGAKKKRKAQRPLIVPALPLNIKPRSMPAGEPAPSPSTKVEPSTLSEEEKSVALPAQGPEEVPATVHGFGLQLHHDTVDESTVPATEGRHQRHQSSVAPEVLAHHTESSHDEAEIDSRSVTPKASSKATPSSTQSPAPEPVQVGSHVNGVVPEGPQNRSLDITEITNTQLDPEAQALVQSNQTVQPNNTMMPQRYFNNEEPILDWADEMSEEMAPDTLYIPSVPHLPELPSDSNFAQDTNMQAIAHASAQIPPAKPVFGSTAVSELQSNSIAKDYPSRGGHHLTNGFSYTPEFEAKYTKKNLIPSKPDRNTTSFVNGHVRETSQILTEQPLSDLATHLTKLFETKEWVDWTIQVVSLNASYPPVAYSAHGVVISRSPFLHSQMRSRVQTRTMTAAITLSPPRYLQPAAFEAALKYLYNEVPLNPAECARYFSFDGTIADSTVKSYRMDFCVSYWLTGCLLGLEPVSEAGLELIYENLDWDTAELLINAALDLKNSPDTQYSSTFVNGATLASSAPGATASPAATRTRDAGTKQADIHNSMHSSQIIGVLMDSLANRRLEVDLKNFNIDTSPPDILPSYLPNVPKQDKSSHSALASITFGSLPTTSLGTSKLQNRSSQPVLFSSSPENYEAKHSSAERSLSAILLNLPFPELNQLFEGFTRSFTKEDVVNVFSKVIQERETRRMKVAGSDWYRSELSLKRGHIEVDMIEELAHEGDQHRLICRDHADVLESIV